MLQSVYYEITGHFDLAEKQLLGVIVRVRSREPVGLFRGHALDALLRLEVELDPEPLVAGVDEAVGMTAVPVHVGDAFGNAAV